LSLEAAAREAAQHGLVPHILSDAIEGEARDVAQVHAALAREIACAQPAVSQSRRCCCRAARPR
jgi:glycerate-2-kinase